MADAWRMPWWRIVYCACLAVVIVACAVLTADATHARYAVYDGTFSVVWYKGESRRGATRFPFAFSEDRHRVAVSVAFEPFSRRVCVIYRIGCVMVWYRGVVLFSVERHVRNIFDEATVLAAVGIEPQAPLVMTVPVQVYLVGIDDLVASEMENLLNRAEQGKNLTEFDFEQGDLVRNMVHGLEKRVADVVGRVHEPRASRSPVTRPVCGPNAPIGLCVDDMAQSIVEAGVNPYVQYEYVKLICCSWARVGRLCWPCLVHRHTVLDSLCRMSWLHLCSLKFFVTPLPDVVTDVVSSALRVLLRPIQSEGNDDTSGSTRLLQANPSRMAAVLESLVHCIGADHAVFNIFFIHPTFFDDSDVTMKYAYRSGFDEGEMKIVRQAALSLPLTDELADPNYSVLLAVTERLRLVANDENATKELLESLEPEERAAYTAAAERDRFLAWLPGGRLAHSSSSHVRSTLASVWVVLSDVASARHWHWKALVFSLCSQFWTFLFVMGQSVMCRVSRAQIVTNTFLTVGHLTMTMATQSRGFFMSVRVSGGWSFFVRSMLLRAWSYSRRICH